MIAKMYFDISRLRFEHKDFIVGVNNNLLYLSNSEENRKKYCFGKLIRQYGDSMKGYVHNSVFGFSEFDITTLKYAASESGIVSNLYDPYLKEFNCRTQNLEALLIFLWFIKDNSVGLYGTYGQIPDVNIVNGKSRSIVNYTCSGKIEDAIFTETELKEAGKLVTKYSSICGLSRNIIDDTNYLWEYDDNGNIIKGIPPKTPEKFSYHDQNAIDRAMHFLIIARNQNYLMYRIAYYMPILECLFNTKGTDITLRIAQRAALYVGETPEERKHIFDTITAGYDIRSKFIHGGASSSEQEVQKATLEPLSIELDKYLRIILKKAISEDSEIFILFSTTLMDEYFNSLLFNTPLDIEKLKQEARERKAQSDAAKEENKLKAERRRLDKERVLANQQKKGAHVKRGSKNKNT